jgi:hypothetical protein
MVGHGVFKAVLQHKPTFKTFVYHQEGMSYIQDLPHDSKAKIEWSVYSSKKYLIGLYVEFLGIRCRPELSMVSACGLLDI